MRPHNPDETLPRRFRVRLSTLMLLVVIVALGAALIVQGVRSARREAQLHAALQDERTRANVQTRYIQAMLQAESARFNGQFQVAREATRTLESLQAPPSPQP